MKKFFITTSPIFFTMILVVFGVRYFQGNFLLGAFIVELGLAGGVQSTYNSIRSESDKLSGADKVILVLCTFPLLVNSVFFLLVSLNFLSKMLE
ncbi:hypothetical protein [Chitinimonas sp. BJB300]|uniref:hypothetical protein n=1 Tax=Chitinimonas sp. BJB300 TaxID=1559339 RepID=UPI000C104883|nr:hypothetical protein [Chitinimonas sp. BJB300]PHV12238.1 hypothetical protein CSQ89_06835 [Chitinimonas sp. BJB300]TSJ85212.1 hypothetical protein FG002_018100 [Chitinimonas sp. BJB300]